MFLGKYVLIRKESLMRKADIYTIVCEVAKYFNQPDDGFCEDITEQIIEDNGTDLSENEVRELAEEYFDEEEDD